MNILDKYRELDDEQKRKVIVGGAAGLFFLLLIGLVVKLFFIGNDS